MLASGWRLSGIFRGSVWRAADGPAPAPIARCRASRRRRSAPTRCWTILYGDKTINNWLNPAAFAQPALGTYGNSVRNAYDGPGFRTVDLSLVRQFRCRAPSRVEARVEAFNAFNWFLPGNPDVNLSSATFGRITSFSTAAIHASCSSRCRYLF